jgi:hypothetical protein
LVPEQLAVVTAEYGDDEFEITEIPQPPCGSGGTRVAL